MKPGLPVTIQAGKAVTVTASLELSESLPIKAASVSWVLGNKRGDKVAEQTMSVAEVAAANTAGQVSITINAAFNSLTSGTGPQIPDARIVTVTMTDTVGTKHTCEILYFVVSSKLAINSNTFCDYYDAVSMASSLPREQSAAVMNEERAEIEAQLLDAYRKLSALPVVVSHSKSKHRGRRVFALTSVELEEVFALSPSLRIALIEAQVTEVAATLNVDPVQVARASGMISMTVGESSQFFGSQRSIGSQLMSRRVISVLGPWLDYSARIGRS